MSKPIPQDPALVHTLESLTEALGDADSDLEDALLEGASDAELIKTGASIASKHILSDQRRIYSQAFEIWNNATAEQKDALRGFSKELLAVAVRRAVRLEGMLVAHEERQGAHGTSKEVRDTAARTAFTSGLIARDQAYTVLLGVAGQNAALRAEIELAVGTAENGEALANGLDKLIAVGKRFLEQKKGPLAKRAKLMRLDTAYLAKLAAIAATVRDTAKQAAARAGGKGVTQGALDREDGVNLILLEAILDAFEMAHDVDATIPRLIPIATRRLFSSHRKKTEDPKAVGDKTNDGKDG